LLKDILFIYITAFAISSAPFQASFVDARSHHADEFGVRKGLPAVWLLRSPILEDGFDIW
jgi:hypothetical protein